MSRRTAGSRRWCKENRRRRRLVAKNTHVRVNQQRHTALAAVAKPGVRSIAVENTRLRNMTRSAVGTKAHPARSAGKRGLNRSLAEMAPARMLTYLERAAARHSIRYVPVNPAGTSQTCFVCGERGQRETQALFRCPQCGSDVNADVNAALNIDERGPPNLYPRPGGGRDSRRKTLNNTMGTFLTGIPKASTKVSQTNTPINLGT